MMNRFRPIDFRDHATPNDGWADFGFRGPRLKGTAWRSLRHSSHGDGHRAHAIVHNDALGGLTDLHR